MKAYKLPTISAACFVLWMVGCSSPGILISRQEMDADPAMTVAPADANYSLFIAGESKEIEVYPLKKDQPIGFRRDEQGQIRYLSAVAGDEHMPLDITKTYEWRRQQ